MVILVPLVETQLHLVLVFIYKEMVEVAEPVYLLVQEMVVVVVEVLLGVVQLEPAGGALGPSGPQQLVAPLLGRALLRRLQV